MPYEQPADSRPPLSQGNNQFSLDLGISIDETFFAYSNRSSTDNRSAQVHLGPSEIGTPCDRRLAMGLLKVRPVNPGGDGFAAWLGTQGHRGMADIYEWADGGSGRFAVETPLNFPSKQVPRGTGDLLDRRLRCFVDWKFMGTWALKALSTKGPSETYRVQLHTYAYGAAQRGEKVDWIALVGLPRQGSSLKEKYVWSEPYDKSVAVSALARVKRIAEDIREDQANSVPRIDTLQAMSIAKDCTFCDFHLPGSNDLTFACNGKH
jgi:hypothetical protein